MLEFNRLRYESIALCLAPYLNYSQLRDLQTCAEVNRFKPNLLHFLLEVLMEDHITEDVVSGGIVSQTTQPDLTSSNLTKVVNALTATLLDSKSKPWAKLLKNGSLPVSLRQMLISLDAVIEAAQEEDGLLAVIKPTRGTEIFQHIHILDEFFGEQFTGTACCKLLVAARVYLADCIDTMVRRDCNRYQYYFPFNCLKTKADWSINRSIKAAILRMRDAMYGFKGIPNYNVDYVSHIAAEVCRMLDMTSTAHFKYNRTEDYLQIRCMSNAAITHRVRIGGFWSFEYIYFDIIPEGQEDGAQPPMIKANLCHVDDVVELAVNIAATIQNKLGILSVA